LGGQGALESWRQVDSEWLGAADDLALALQSATNNTSLVLAIEFLEPQGKGDVLLFAGDAQVGNWLSWQDLRWALAKSRETTGPDLLRRTTFYKVGHHGSHNATLRQKGLEMMTELKVAVVPVDQEVARKMRWGAMPLETLVAALSKTAKKGVLRTDMDPVKRIDGVSVDPFFFDIAV